MGVHGIAYISMWKMEQIEDNAISKSTSEVKNKLMKKKFLSCDNLYTDDYIKSRLKANESELYKKLKGITRSKSAPIVSNSLLKKKLKRCGSLYTEAIIKNKIKANKKFKNSKESIHGDFLIINDFEEDTMMTDQEIIKQIDVGFNKMFKLIERAEKKRLSRKNGD